MKKNIVLWLLALVLLAASFFAGSYVKEQEYKSGRVQRCGTFVSFALDKAENGGLSDQDTMEALISNIYAAYAFCDDPVLQDQLHDLWNVLMFDGVNDAAAQDRLVVELQSISAAIRGKNG